MCFHLNAGLLQSELSVEKTGEIMRDILIIDDDRELCALLKDYLEPEGFHCTFVHNGADGLARIEHANTDLVILDVMLPGKNGFEVLSALRSCPEKAALPVIMLTARGDDVNRVVGLEMGADDYLPKPFNPRELLARIRAVLRRTAASVSANTEERSPDIVLDEGTLRARVDAVSVELTGQECRLLRMLLETPGELVSRERLCREGLGHAPRPFDRSLDMQISRIRKKIGLMPDGSERIRSIRGEGYMVVLPGKVY